MITYRLWERHQHGEMDLRCPVIVCDACHRQITGHGNVYWTPTGDRVWHTHKWPCSQLDEVIESETGDAVLFEELSVWLDQLTRNTLEHAAIPEPREVTP